jgi:hypothetical protein
VQCTSLPVMLTAGPRLPPSGVEGPLTGGTHAARPAPWSRSRSQGHLVVPRSLVVRGASRVAEGATNAHRIPRDLSSAPGPRSNRLRDRTGVAEFPTVDPALPN